MEIKIAEKEFANVKTLLGGLITEENAEGQTFTFLANPGLTFNDGMQMLQSITLHMLLAYKQQHPEATNDIYDAYNFMASSILQYLIPDKELRPDLTEEAIMRAENEIVEEKYNSLNREQRRAGAKAVAKMKKDIAKKRNGNKAVQEMPEV